MSNYSSIPQATRTSIDTFIHQDNIKNAIGRLWIIFLRTNHDDFEYAEGELQDFLNGLDHNQPSDLILDTINQKIEDIQREELGITGRGGLKRHKTSNKRKRTSKKTTKKTTKKKRIKRRKTIKVV
jgi:hypothetical protein